MARIRNRYDTSRTIDTSWPQVRARYVEIDTGMIRVELDTSWPQVYMRHG